MRIKKTGQVPAFSLQAVSQSAGNYISRTWTFFALSDLILDFLAFIERGVAAGLNLGMVDKQILAAIVLINKTKALARIEPFYCSCTHLYFSLADMLAKLKFLSFSTYGETPER